MSDVYCLIFYHSTASGMYHSNGALDSIHCGRHGRRKELHNAKTSREGALSSDGLCVG